MISRWTWNSSDVCFYAFKKSQTENFDYAKKNPKKTQSQWDKNTIVLWRKVRDALVQELNEKTSNKKLSGATYILSEA